MNEKKFEKMGDIYTKYRPSYPKEFIDYLYEKSFITKKSIIADVGAGTGKFTKLFLDRGNKVFLVEPNDDMRNVAEEELKSYANLTTLNGNAENTKLKDNSVDFITVAQAFHWFDCKAFKAECKRTLKTDGKVLLVWNSRNPESEVTIDSFKVNQLYCTNFTGFSGGMNWDTVNEDMEEFFGGDYEELSFANDFEYDEESFIGRQLSSSYALKESDEKYIEYIDALKSVFTKYSNNGIILDPNTTKAYLGKI